MSLKQYLEIIWYRAITDLQSEASRAYVGILWWFLEPAFFLLTFYIAFSYGIRGSGVDFVPFLLTGLVPWRWFGDGVQSGMNCIAANKGLIQQTHIPKHALLFIKLVSSAMKFFFVLFVAFAILYYLGYPPQFSWLGLIPLMLIQLVLIIGCASLAAAIVPFLPDLKLVISSVMTMLFFTSGIFYVVAERSPEVQSILYLNPMVSVLDGYREIILHGGFPDYSKLGWPISVGVVCGIVGFAMLVRYDRVYPKVVI